MGLTGYGGKSAMRNVVRIEVTGARSRAVKMRLDAVEDDLVAKTIRARGVGGVGGETNLRDVFAIVAVRGDVARLPGSARPAVCFSPVYVSQNYKILILPSDG